MDSIDTKPTDDERALRHTASLAQTISQLPSEGDFTTSSLLAAASFQNRLQFEQSGRLISLKSALYLGILSVAFLSTNGTSNDDKSLMVFNGIADVLLAKFEVFGKRCDLDRATSFLRQGLRQASPAAESRAATYCALALCLEKKYNITLNIKDIEQAVCAGLLAVWAVPIGHPDRGLHFHNVGDKSSVLYQRTKLLRHFKRTLASAEMAVSLTPEGHPNRPGYLNNLATSISIKAEFTQSRELMEAAVRLAQETVRTANPEEHRYPLFLDNLSVRLSERFRVTKDREDIDEAIRISNKTTAANEAFHAENNRHSINVASLYYARFKAFNNTEDLLHAIEVARNSFQAPASDDFVRIASAMNLSQCLESLYNSTRDIQHLEEAIRISRETIGSHLPLSTSYGDHLEILSQLLLKRFRHLREESDLVEASELAQQAVLAPSEEGMEGNGRWLVFSNLAVGLAETNTYESSLETSAVDRAYAMAEDAMNRMSSNDPNRPKFLNNLAAVLQHKLARQGSEDDLAAAIALIQEALDHPALLPFDRPMLQSNMSFFIELRYDHTNNRDDLNMAVTFAEQALEGAQAEARPDLGRFLTGLASAHVNQYKRTSDVHDIERACDLAEEAVNVTSATEGGLQAQYMHNASLYFGTKAQSEHASLQDYENAVLYSEAAVSATPEQYYLYRRYLHALGTHLALLSSRTKSLPTLERAIAVVQDALEMTPEGTVNKAHQVDSLARLLHRKFEITGNAEDLHLARDLGTVAVNMAPTPPSISCLSNYWEDCYGISNDQSDLDTAIDLAKRAVDVCPVDFWEYSGLLRNLGNKFSRKYQAARDQQDLRAALEAYQRGANAALSPPKSLILAARNAAKLQLEAGDLDGGFITLQKAVSLLPKLNPRHFEREDKQFATGEEHVKDLASDAAALALAAGLAPIIALQILESGNAVMFASIVDCRSDVTDLKAYDEHLYNDFEALRRLLDTPSSNASQSPFTEGSESTEATARRRRRVVAEEMDRTIAKIRDLPGFTDFFKPPSEETLKELSEPGPIVVLNQSFLVSRCDAIIVTPQEITSIHLENMKYSQEPIEDPQDKFSLERDVYVGGLRTFGRRNKRLNRILSHAWELAVEPVCAHLGIKSAAETASMPHIWWVRIGWPFNVMPIHAAGDNSPGSINNAYSRLVSSYVPSIKALLYARERDFTLLDTENPHLLIATMEETPGECTLRGVVQEADSITALASGKFTIQRLPDPTAEDVLKALTISNATHFSCHGSTFPQDPSLSALVFKTTITKDNLPTQIQDPLTVSAISVLNTETSSRSNMQLAFLSACASAGVDNQTLANEALHIAGGFLLAGFVHVVATLWLVRDDVCVEVSTRFWSGILEGLGVGETRAQRHERVRRALHEAIRGVRDKYWDQPLLWAPWVAFGA